MRALVTIVFGVLFAMASASGARAINCPETQAECADIRCCGGNQLCCAQTGVCCDVDTPYCCEDGTCAATPSACSQPSVACPDYEIRCADVCIPAGSDCCNSNGDHCSPTETCQGGGDHCAQGDNTLPILSKLDKIRHPSTVKLNPSGDPEGLTRTCATVAVRSGDDVPFWLLGGLALLVRCSVRRRQHTWLGSTTKGRRV